MNTTATAPEFRTELLTVKIEDVLKGDTFARAGKEKVVHAAKLGTKWVELRDEQGVLIIRQQVGTTVPVAREVETDESKARRNRALSNETIRKSVAKRDVNTATTKALAKINEKVAQGYTISSFEMSDLIAAQAEDRVYDRFTAFVTNNVGRVNEETGEVVDETAAMEAYREILKDRLIGAFDLTRGLSRSTSVVSNIMDDAEREATVEFVRHAGNRMWF